MDISYIPPIDPGGCVCIKSYVLAIPESGKPELIPYQFVKIRRRYIYRYQIINKSLREREDEGEKANTLAKTNISGTISK